jgi:hypothetical protein
MPRKRRGSESEPKPPTLVLFGTNAHDPDSCSSPVLPNSSANSHAKNLQWFSLHGPVYARSIQRAHVICMHQHWVRLPIFGHGVTRASKDLQNPYVWRFSTDGSEIRREHRKTFFVKATCTLSLLVSVSKEHSMQVALTLTPKNRSGSYIATPFAASYIADNKEMKATAGDLF